MRMGERNLMAWQCFLMWWLPPPLLSHNSAGKFGKMFTGLLGEAGLVSLGQESLFPCLTGGCRKFLILVQFVHPI